MNAQSRTAGRSALSPRIGRLGVVVAVAVSLAACSGEHSETSGAPTGDPTTTSSVNRSPTTPAPTTDSGPHGDELAPGRHFVFVTALEREGATFAIEFDVAQWLSGEAADRAAIEDGMIAPGEHAENDYYIRNVNPRLRTMPVSGDAGVRVVDWDHCCEPVGSTLDALAVRGFDTGRDSFWLTVASGVVVEVEEQYRP